MSVDFDARSFAKAIDRGIAEFERDGERALDDLADFLVGRAKQAAPVDTGALRDSIGVVARGRDASGPYIDIGATDEAAPYQEFGTEHNPPAPFLRPAFAEAPGKFGK